MLKMLNRTQNKYWLRALYVTLRYVNYKRWICLLSYKSLRIVFINLILIGGWRIIRKHVIIVLDHRHKIINI